MSTLPDSVYDDAVRALLRCPPRHTHISIGHLRATIDDPAAFRAALTVAYEAGAEDALAMRDAATLLSDPAAGAVIDTAFSAAATSDRHSRCEAVNPATGNVCESVPHWPELPHWFGLREQWHDIPATTVAEARASVALDGETVTLDGPPTNTRHTTDQCLNCAEPIFLVTVPGGGKKWTHDARLNFITGCGGAT